MDNLKQFHGLPCNCYTRRVLLGLLPDPFGDSCPSMCSPETPIVGISNAFTVDGWYVEADLSNLVYMEADVIIDRVACTSGLAYYKLIESDQHTTFGFAYVAGSWVTMSSLHLAYKSGLDFDVDASLNILGGDHLQTIISISYDGLNYENLVTFDGESYSGLATTTGLVFLGKMRFTWEECFYDFIVCPYYAPSFWDYQVPSADESGGFWRIFALLATLSDYTGLTFDIEGSVDAGTTWTTIALNIPYVSFDGSTGINVGVTYPTPFRSRIKITSSLGCISYSAENTNTE